MKKLLALLMALAMVFTLVACGNKEEAEGESKPEVTTEVTEAFDENDYIDLGDEEEEETEAEETEAEETSVVEVTNADGEAVTDKDGEAVTETVTKEPSSTKKPTTTKKTDPADKKVEDWSHKEILDYYNAAVIKTDPKAPAGNSKMVLSGGITGDGAIGAILKVLSPAAEKALAKNSTPTDFIPGYGEIKLSDLYTLRATDKGDSIVVEMTVKEQTDGPAADDKAGPVGRAIGTLGNIDGALNELGASISEGRDTVKLTYNNVSVKATINKKTGLITAGTWHYLVNISIGDAKASISVVSANLKNLKAAVDYTVVI